MSGQIKVFDKMTVERLRLILIFGELIWIGAAFYYYFNYEDCFSMFAPFIFVLNMLTLLPFYGIIKKMKNSYHEDVFHLSDHTEAGEKNLLDEPFGIWEKVCLGFYITSNSFLLGFLLYWTFYWRFYWLF